MVLSIIIVSWNTRDLLRGCLNSICDNPSHHRLEVIVVDNGSTDGSVDMVRAKFPQVKLVDLGQNVGFPRGNNIGLTHATGDLIMMLNPDTVVHPGMIGRLADFLATHPEAGAAGPHTVDGHGRIQMDCARHCPSVWTEFTMHTFLYRLFPRNRWFGRYCMTYWDHASTRPVEMVSGACLVVKREVINRIGFLDEGSFMYHEDMDFCIRIHKAGYRLYYVHDAVLTHYGGQSSKRIKAYSLLRIAKAYWYLFEKHHRPWEYRMVRWITKSGALLRILLWALLLPFRWRDRQVVTERVRGYWHIILAR